MKNFDPIDILFICLISCYLVTFIAIIVMVSLKYRDYKKNKLEDDNDNLERFEKVLATPIVKGKKKAEAKNVSEKTEKKEENKSVPKKKSSASKKNATSNKTSAPKKKQTTQKQTTKKISTAKKASSNGTKKSTTAKKNTTTNKSVSKKTGSTSTKNRILVIKRKKVFLSERFFLYI